jgi:hypothetical protein
VAKELCEGGCRTVLLSNLTEGQTNPSGQETVKIVPGREDLHPSSSTKATLEGACLLAHSPRLATPLMNFWKGTKMRNVVAREARKYTAWPPTGSSSSSDEEATEEHGAAQSSTSQGSCLEPSVLEAPTTQSPSQRMPPPEKVPTPRKTLTSKKVPTPTKEPATKKQTPKKPAAFREEHEPRSRSNSTDRTRKRDQHRG